jgi:hypothetical protein
VTVTTEVAPPGSPNKAATLVTCYINFKTGAEADEDKATGAIVSEYDASGKWLAEHVLQFTPG